MTQFLQATINGLSLAGIYALIAVGFVVIYKSTQVLSFAQPALVLTGAYFVSYLAFTLGWNFWLGLVVAILITVLLALVVERTALRPMIGKPVFSVAILTIGLDIAIRTVINDLIGVDVRGVGSPWTGQWDWFGALVLHSQVATVVISVMLVAATIVFFQYSRLGLAMRAAAFDQEVALAQGISVAVVFAVAWGMAGGLAAVAGMLIGTGFAGVSASSAFVALKALPAIVVGGIDSLTGAIVGSLVIGLAEAYTATYQAGNFEFLGDNFSQVTPWLVMFIVLLVRPYGLFGTKEVERV